MPKKATIQTKFGVIMDLAARQEEIIMREKFSGSMIKVAIAAAAASTIILPSVVRAPAQGPTGSGATPAASPSLKTPWGEPDLQGIWTRRNNHAFAATRQVREPGSFHRGR